MHVPIFSPAECKNGREGRKAKAQTTPVAVVHRRQPMLPPCIPALAPFRSRKEHHHQEAVQQTPEVVQPAKRPRIKSADAQAPIMPPPPSRRTAKIAEIIDSPGTPRKSRNAKSSANATGRSQELNRGSDSSNTADLPQTCEVCIIFPKRGGNCNFPHFPLFWAARCDFKCLLLRRCMSKPSF